jgi:hypothetical protein
VFPNATKQIYWYKYYMWMSSFIFYFICTTVSRKSWNVYPQIMKKLKETLAERKGHPKNKYQLFFKWKSLISLLSKLQIATIDIFILLNFQNSKTSMKGRSKLFPFNNIRRYKIRDDTLKKNKYTRQMFRQKIW